MSSDDEHIRKMVGRTEREKRPLQRMYELWKRMKRLDIQQPNKNERIRKVVGRSDDGER